MTKIFYSLLILLMINLTGCSLFKKNSDSAKDLDIEPINWYQQQATCKTTVEDKNCPSYKVTSVHFTKAPALNTLVEQRIVKLMDIPANMSLKAYLDQYLAQANVGDSIDINVNLLERNDIFYVLEIAIQKSLANDHYSPKKLAIINFDRKQQKDIGLVEAIKPNKVPAFWTVARTSYNQWLEAKQLLNNKMFQEDWPFVETQHIVLLSKHILLKYDANTLAPYAMGEPTLIIANEQLRDILKAKYLPR